MIVPPRITMSCMPTSRIGRAAWAAKKRSYANFHSTRSRVTDCLRRADCNRGELAPGIRCSRSSAATVRDPLWIMEAERRMHALQKRRVGAENDHEIVTGVGDDHGFIF
jgi:hypothetical protein